MYPVKLGLQEAIKRINALITNNHQAEALVTSVFTFEKLMKRTLRRAIVARGFEISHAENLLENLGFEAIAKMLPVFEKSHRDMHALIGGLWGQVKAAKNWRNDFVHGNKVHNRAECAKKAKYVIKAIEKLHGVARTDYGVDVWQKKPVKRLTLGWKV